MLPHCDALDPNLPKRVLFPPAEAATATMRLAVVDRIVGKPNDSRAVRVHHVDLDSPQSSYSPPSGSRWNRMRRPSGDHATGQSEVELSVSRTAPVPSAFIT